LQYTVRDFYQNVTYLNTKPILKINIILLYIVILLLLLLLLLLITQSE